MDAPSWMVELQPKRKPVQAGHFRAPAFLRMQVPLQRVLVVYDDMDMPHGTVRLRAKGGHGGHNGMRSITQHFSGSKDFPRLRLGTSSVLHQYRFCKLFSSQPHGSCVVHTVTQIHALYCHRQSKRFACSSIAPERPECQDVLQYVCTVWSC